MEISNLKLVLDLGTLNKAPLGNWNYCRWTCSDSFAVYSH